MYPSAVASRVDPPTARWARRDGSSSARTVETGTTVKSDISRPTCPPSGVFHDQLQAHTQPKQGKLA
jgi:hypothetical protein